MAPTFNEAANVAALVERLDRRCRDVRWQVIFVDDDSPDGTAAAVKAVARPTPACRCLRRIGAAGWPAR